MHSLLFHEGFQFYFSSLNVVIDIYIYIQLLGRYFISTKYLDLQTKYFHTKPYAGYEQAAQVNAYS